MTELRLVQVDHDTLPPLERFDDRTVHQTGQWLQFLANTQNARIVAAVINRGNETVGRFTGLVFSRYGLSLLGSPFPGWSTSYMGFNLSSSVSRLDALIALERFAFQDLHCVHYEIMDRRLTVDEIRGLPVKYRNYSGFEIDLRIDERGLFAGMTPACRRCIRKADKEGVQVEEALDASTFVEEYYDQLRDVFIKQSLSPTYKIERVRELVAQLHKSGHLLLARAKNPEGVSIATGVFPALNDTMYFWGGASWRSFQHLRPNEALQWFAMRYWKSRAIAKYDMGGGGEYKRKYGGTEISVPWIRKSKYPIVEMLREQVKNLYALRQRMLGLYRSRRQKSEKVVDHAEV